MVLVGGATRLTESGLSITEWQPVMGALPPLDATQWQAEFEKYQAIPQYRELNRGMSLDAFKSIYWWEWTHRLIGRTIGAAFLLPFLWFLWRGWIGPRLRTRLWVIFGLGALQGAVGWWMVASGLADRVEVSQYRLATHLVARLRDLCRDAMDGAAVRATRRRAGARRASARRHRPAGSGAGADLSRRAGRRAACRLRLQYLAVDRRRVRPGSAARFFFDTPLWRNFFENTLTVQFDHRMLAYAIWICRAHSRLRCGAHDEKGRCRLGAIVLLGGDAAGGARHFDAADGACRFRSRCCTRRWRCWC